MLLRVNFTLSLSRVLCSTTSRNYYAFDSQRNLFASEKACIVSNNQKRNLTQASNDSWFSIDSPPINCLYNLLNTVHDNLGLPWWASIVVSTFALRTCVTLPIFVLTAQNNAKMELLAPEVKQLAHALKAEVAHAKNVYKWTDRQAALHFRKNLKRHLVGLHSRENCHPAKNFILPWIQIPIWMSMSFALRHMSGTINSGSTVLTPELATEGALWFQNLLMPDMFGLPLIFCLCNLLITEIYNLKVKNPNRPQKFVINFLRATNIIMVPIAATCPSSMSLFWACSSAYGLGQNLLLSSPRCRRIFGIPKAPSESPTPFKDNWNLFKTRYNIQS